MAGGDPDDDDEDGAAGASPVQALAFGAVFVLAQHLARLGDDRLAELGITTKQWLLLAVISRGFPGQAPTLSEAAARYGSSRQNVKAIAQQLADRGWLEMLVDPADRRALRLHLTDRVAAFDTAAWRRTERSFFQSIFGRIPAGDVARLAELLAAWLAVLDPGPRPDHESQE